jgi:pyrroloquinoline quinone (PQQ) biosynthesis protein C
LTLKRRLQINHPTGYSAEMNLEHLKDRLETEFGRLASSPYLAKVMEPGFVDKRLYAIYLTETYHYTRHNSRNQAVIATRPDDMDVRYIKFCLRHAEEEAGHEKMALHDLKNLGYAVDEITLPKPLVSTQTLISYLYYTAETANPFARLGYSYWAEQSYHFIQPLLDMISKGLGVPDKAMTFFREHSSIDEEHAKQVMETITRFAKTEDDWSSIEDCMVNSLILTTRMMDEVFEEFMKVKSGIPSRYHFLK